MWLDDAGPEFRQKLTAALYGKGWVRVGCSLHGDSDLIEFEGTQGGLDGASKAIDDLLASWHGCRVERTVRR